jgi:chromosome segregation ATPase
MNWVLWIYAISALASALAAVLAWAAKLWWAKEYASAKDETIKSKDAQIERLKGEIQSVRELTNDIVKAKETQVDSLKNEIQNLKELTPMKIQEYFKSVKVQLEEYNDMLQKKLDDAKAEIKERDAAISIYSQGTDEAIEQINKLKIEKAKLEERAAALESQLSKVREEESKAQKITTYYLDSSVFKNFADSRKVNWSEFKDKENDESQLYLQLQEWLERDSEHQGSTEEKNASQTNESGEDADA